MDVQSQKTMSVAISGFGVGLLVFMVTVENEPGAIPLALILTGAIGYVTARRREKRSLAR